MTTISGALEARSGKKKEQTAFYDRFQPLADPDNNVISSTILDCTVFQRFKK